MTTRLFVLASVLLVAAELAIAIAISGQVDMAERAEQVEERLDRALQAWVDRTFALGPSDAPSDCRPGDQRSIRCSGG